MIATNRRQVLLTAAGFGLNVSLFARMASAAGGARPRLIVVVLRGGLDGLSLSPPAGDPDYAGLRGPIAIQKPLMLDRDFGLHPALASVHKLALAGQARIAPAAATPDRARSHFEAQDVLESGASKVYGASSGWLNRAVGVLAARGKVDALSIGATAPLVIRGPAAVSSWSPGGPVDSEARLPTLLQDLYKDDPVLGPAFGRGLATEDMAREAMSAMAAEGAPMSMTTPQAPGVQGLVRAGAEASRKLGITVAGFLREPTGPQIAALSVDGFDTHANQGADEGQLATRLSYLDALLDGLQSGLGPAWSETVIVAATEFGRTARMNGTRGTDHGTASTALVLGGSLKRGGLIGDWPGLKSQALFENRDLAPTVDMRGLFKGLLAEQLGLERRVLDTEVFPDSAAVAPVAALV